jgi:hypothetical protein
MEGSSMHTDADVAYLDMVRDDCARILGAGVQVVDLVWDEADPVTLTLRYQMGPVHATTVADGESVIAAHAALRQRLVVDRLKLGLDALTRVAP